MRLDDHDIPIEPKAGKFGVACVVVFGILSILVAFVAAYMWVDGDSQLAGALGVMSIMIPTTIGYFMSELRHQRSGAFWFVVSAAILAGALASWSYAERDDFDRRMDLLDRVTSISE